MEQRSYKMPNYSNYYSTSSSTSSYVVQGADGSRRSVYRAEQSQTDPRGTTVRSASQRDDEPMQYSERHFPAGEPRGDISGEEPAAGWRRIEDVSDETGSGSGEGKTGEVKKEGK